MVAATELLTLPRFPRGGRSGPQTRGGTLFRLVVGHQAQAAAAKWGIRLSVSYFRGGLLTGRGSRFPGIGIVVFVRGRWMGEGTPAGNRSPLLSPLMCCRAQEGRAAFRGAGFRLFS